MKQFKITLLFVVINFGGLALGSWLMNNGPQTNWYTNLAKAPWSPPGWLFGVAWTTIMLCFSIYLGKLFIEKINSKLIILFFIQFMCNVSWNYVFFNQHSITLGLVNIVFLTSIIFIYFFSFSKLVKNYKYLLLPYMIWLCIATSLNLYIVVHN